MIHHLQIVPFVIGVAVGLFLILFYQAGPRILYEYPHPQNVNNRIYRDKQNICYQYNSVQVDCDENEGGLKPYPLQG
jgi:hypothetical protein